MTNGIFNSTVSTTPAVSATGTNGADGIDATTDTGTAVNALCSGFALGGLQATTGIAISATGPTGISATSNAQFGIGVHAVGGGATATEDVPVDQAAIFAEGGPGPGLYATSNGSSAAVNGAGTTGAAGVTGSSDSGTGVSASSQSGVGVQAEGGPVGVFAKGGALGVWAVGGGAAASVTSQEAAILAEGGPGTGVIATSGAGTGVSASSISGPGVSAFSNNGPAVDAKSQNGIGVHAVGGGQTFSSLTGSPVPLRGSLPAGSACRVTHGGPALM